MKGKDTIASIDNASVCSMDHGNTLEMIKLYSDEWKYRHEHYWSIFIKFSILCYLVILFPYSYEAFHVDLAITKMPLEVFPFIGVVSSIMFFILYLSEAARMKATGETVKALVYKFNLQYNRINIDDIDDIKFKKLVKIQIAQTLPWINLIMQVVLSITIFVYLRLG